VEGTAVRAGDSVLVTDRGEGAAELTTTSAAADAAVPVYPE